MNAAKFWTLLEKGRYPFKAYPPSSCRSVFFGGCSFCSQFPRTNAALVGLVRGHATGVVYDCCAMPVDRFGGHARARAYVEGIARRLGAIGCEEVVFSCPTCYDYLARRLAPYGVEAVTIYQKLAEWGVGQACRIGPGVLFIPCPDRRGLVWRDQIARVADLGALVQLKGAPCCGLEPSAASRGPDYVRKLDERAFSLAQGLPIWTYCASCCGQFARMGYAGGTRHVLSAILGIDEAPDTVHALRNRARHLLDRRAGLLPSRPEKAGPQ